MKTFKILLSTILIMGLNLSFAQTARVQIIHNSADAAAEVVDVWLNTTKLIENFAFRTATPYIDAPAGVLLNIGIAPPNSTSWTQSFRIKQVALTANETYVVVAGGIISTSGYTPSPIFDVNVYPIGREAASQPGNTDVLVVHGATDAPTVDIYETGVGAGQIVNDLIYGNVAGYLELSTMNYVLEIRDETGMNTLAAFDAPLANLGLEDSAITVVASGFLNPGNNSNGPAFGLWVALPSGGPLLELPVHSVSQTALVQVIHNSADVLAGAVDVYINDVLTIDNFAFRAATPFIPLPAGVTLNIGIAPGNSTTVNDTLANFPVILSADENYVVFANGVLTSGYAPNPDGRNIDFTLFVKTMARTSASGSDVDLFVLHGSTDAPTVDVKAREAGNLVLVDDAAYGDITPYFSVPAGNYTLDLYLADGTTLVESFIAPLAGFGGGAASVFASGFLNPANNQNGAPFGIFVALVDGTVIELATGVVPVELSSFTALISGKNVTLNWITASEVNNSGFEIQRKSENEFAAIGFVDGNGTTTNIQNYSFTDENLSAGTYIYRLKQVDFNGTFEYSNEIEVVVSIPSEFSLEQNYPNPFNPSTVISFNLAVDSDVSLKVFNILGQEVVSLLNNRVSAGTQQINFNAAGLNSGVYFYQLEAKGIDGSNFSSTRKMLLTK